MEKGGISEYISKGLSFVKSYALIIVLLSAIFLQFVPNDEGNLPWGGIWMRMQVAEFPTADRWAQQSVDNFVNNQVQTEVLKQYPNLPQDKRDIIVAEKATEMWSSQAETLSKEKEKLVNEIKSHWQYESDGKSFYYMPDIDPYHYLRYARNIINTGHPGDEVRDGVEWDSLQVAPFGRPSAHSMHSYVLAGLHVLLGPLLGLDLMQSASYFSVVFIFLSLFPAFFLGRRLGGLAGGFFAVTLIAVLPAIMSRTPWGHADTDAYTIFFPLLIIFLIVEAFTTIGRKRWILLSLAGLSTGIFASAWSGWFFTFDTILLALIAYCASLIVSSALKNRSDFKSWFSVDVINALKVAVFYFIVSAIFATLFTGNLSEVGNALTAPITYSNVKDAANDTLWPNVLTTVAELNPGSFEGLVNSVGGVFAFFVAMLGIFLLISEGTKKELLFTSIFLVWFFLVVNSWSVNLFLLGVAAIGVLTLFSQKRDHLFVPILLLFWFAGTVFASVKGVRFTLLAGPAFAVAFGAGAGVLCRRLGDWSEKHINVKKLITSAFLVFVLALVIVNPSSSGVHPVKESYQRVIQDVPIVNDAWFNSLDKIRKDSAPDAIINSWWDFGHHFRYFAERKVTFDGASQNTPMAHWIGRALSTDNELEAVGILRMLGCGSNRAYETIFNETGDVLKSVKLVKEIILLDSSDASVALDKAGIDADSVLQYSHCSAPENYFITSEDMVGKAGVWSHFGAWDFDKAKIWNEWRNLPESEVINNLKSVLGYDNETASNVYSQLSNLDSETQANSWIGPWTSLTSDIATCTAQSGLLDCGNVKVNISTMEATVQTAQGVGILKSVLVAESDGFNEVESKNANTQFSVVLYPEGGQTKAYVAQSALADSMFVRLFFLNGHGTKYFKLFSTERQIAGGRILVWKVDWSGEQNNLVSGLVKKEQVSNGDQVFLSYIGYLDNGSIFDASYPDWASNGITKDSPFTSEFGAIQFVAGSRQLIVGVDDKVLGMKINETKTIVVSPEQGYGIDPTAHELGNKTLHFKVRVVDIR